MNRSAQRPTNDLTAYDLYLRALAPIRSGEVGRGSHVEALDLLNQAIQRDSRYAPALALAASCRSSLDVAGWIDDAGANRDEALGLTRRALAAARDDPNVLAYGAYVLAYFGEDIIAAIAVRSSDRALRDRAEIKSACSHARPFPGDWGRPLFRPAL